jgi:hypothetical protein
MSNTGGSFYQEATNRRNLQHVILKHVHLATTVWALKVECSTGLYVRVIVLDYTASVFLLAIRRAHGPSSASAVVRIHPKASPRFPPKPDPKYLTSKSCSGTFNM